VRIHSLRGSPLGARALRNWTHHRRGRTGGSAAGHGQARQSEQPAGAADPPGGELRRGAAGQPGHLVDDRREPHQIRQAVQVGRRFGDLDEAVPRREHALMLCGDGTVRQPASGGS